MLLQGRVLLSLIMKQPPMLQGNKNTLSQPVPSKIALKYQHNKESITFAWQAPCTTVSLTTGRQTGDSFLGFFFLHHHLQFNLQASLFSLSTLSLHHKALPTLWSNVISFQMKTDSRAQEFCHFYTDELSEITRKRPM